MNPDKRNPMELQETVDDHSMSFRESVSEIIPPHLLDLYLKQYPYIATLGEETVEGYEERRMAELRRGIENENARRMAESREPVSIVGIHAAAKNDTFTRLILEKASGRAADLGVRTNLLEISDAEGYPDKQHIKDAVEKIKQSDGFIITTHTDGGNSMFMSMLQYELGKADIAGKSVGFYHAFDNYEEAEKFGPAVRAQDFFESKGCVVLPYASMFAHSGGVEEPWAVKEMVHNGFYVTQGIERLARSPLYGYLKDPSKFDQRNTRTLNETTGKYETIENEEWIKLRDRVKAANEKRKNEGREALNVLFVLGGAGFAEGDPKQRGRGARISKVVAKNFENLGFKTNTVHLTSMEIAASSGNPNPSLTQIEDSRSENKDRGMEELYEKILLADVIIFSSPVRWGVYTDALKRMIERTTPLEVSGFLLEGKAMGTIVTSGEAGAKELELTLKQWAHYNGIFDIPFGSIKQQLTYKKDEYPELQEKYPDARRVAAFGASTIVDFLERDGAAIKTIGTKAYKHPLSVIEYEE